MNTLNSLKSKEKDEMQDFVNGLRFLSYKEKLLAGSWRFLTYFGRDSLISLRIIAPIVKMEVIEAGIAGMTDRLSKVGEISHEEDLGDQAYIDAIYEMNKTGDFSK